MKKIILTLVIFSLIIVNVKAVTIKGKVSDENGNPIPGVTVLIEGTTTGTTTDIDGLYQIEVNDSTLKLRFSFVGYERLSIPIKNKTLINIKLKKSRTELNEVMVMGYNSGRGRKNRTDKIRVRGLSTNPGSRNYYGFSPPIPSNESYDSKEENKFLKALDKPLSTFSIDVDHASYSNIRRFLNNGQLPPKEAVRVEEMINYFSYDYPEPIDQHPFAIYNEIGQCPWNKKDLLLHVGLQAKNIPTEELPPSNLVFLIDVSGSMNSPDKLPLLKRSFKMLIKNLREQDNVSIVVYASNTRVVLKPTNGTRKEEIIQAIDQLNAGGYTAGGKGLKLAYEMAYKNFLEEGNNRIILATDGDFNVGPSSDEDMLKLIKKEREKGVFISVLGFGTGNLKDSKMETIADNGNGNYAYIDNFLEAQKVLINEFGGSFFTLAKDVKIQIEFNPAIVESYRLIGYENRMLNEEDFEDDKKDAGEIGSGHSVTALYEIVPAKKTKRINKKLKYQDQTINERGILAEEVGFVKFRYKHPTGKQSKLFSQTIENKIIEADNLSDNFNFSAAVANFGMLLSDSKYKGNADYETTLKLAKTGKGADENGYRSELIRLIKLTQEL